jgi:hypothetical protein
MNDLKNGFTNSDKSISFFDNEVLISRAKIKNIGFLKPVRVSSIFKKIQKKGCIHLIFFQNHFIPSSLFSLFPFRQDCFLKITDANAKPTCIS